MKVVPRLARIIILLFVCFTSIVGCNMRDENSYSDCILKHSEELTSDAGTSAIQAACREKFPPPEIAEKPPEPEKEAYRMLSEVELAQVTIPDDSVYVETFISGLSQSAARYAAGRGERLDWHIAVKIKNGLSIEIVAVELEIMTDGDWEKVFACWMQATFDPANFSCEDLTTYKEIVNIDIPQNGLREAEIPVLSGGKYVVKVNRAITTN